MLTIGALLLCSALLVFAAVSRICDRPVRPQWTKRAGVAELITMFIATLITFGLGLLAVGVGAVGGYEANIEPVDLGMVALVLAGTAFLLRWLGARNRVAPRNARDRAVSVAPASGDASLMSVPPQPSPPRRAA